MSVDILGTSCDQCRSMVQYSLTSTETRRLVRTDSPGRPPRLSHSSWTMTLSALLMIAYIAPFSALEQTHCARHVILHEWQDSAFLVCFVFWISTKVVYLQHWHGCCHMKLLPSRHKFCVHRTTVHHVTSCKATYVRCMRVSITVTCHLHRDLLRATAVTRGWNGYRNKSQHRKLILEKKFLPPLPGCKNSNPRPFSHEAGALTTELSPPTDHWETGSLSGGEQYQMVTNQQTIAASALTS